MAFFKGLFFRFLAIRLMSLVSIGGAVMLAFYGVVIVIKHVVNDEDVTFPFQ